LFSWSCRHFHFFDCAQFSRIFTQRFWRTWHHQPHRFPSVFAPITARFAVRETKPANSHRNFGVLYRRSRRASPKSTTLSSAIITGKTRGNTVALRVRRKRITAWVRPTTQLSGVNQDLAPFRRASETADYRLSSRKKCLLPSNSCGGNIAAVATLD
jgi:hypothetical protein